MWQVDFDRHGTSAPGSLISSWQSSSENTVICLLDPPRNAMPPENYREAQENVSKIYALIPDKETFIVGLQEDFWQETDIQLLARGGPELHETYFESNGLGIVHALSKVDPKPQIVRLESENLNREYASLRSRAVAFMSESAGFFQAITAAIKQARNHHFSPRLQKLEKLSNEYQQSAISLAGYIRQLRDFADSLNIDLNTPRYKSIILFDHTSMLEETSVKEENVKKERDQLAMELHEVAAGGKLAPRAAWELYRYTLNNRFSQKKETEAEVARIDAMLRGKSLPEPTAEVTEKAIALVKERCLIDMRMVRKGEDKADLLGDQGDAVSNLMELGAVLGLDINAYPVLTDYVHHSFVQTHMTSRLRGHQPAAGLLQALLELAEEVTQRLEVTNAEKALLDLKRVAQFLESLGRFHLVYDEDIRDIVMNLSIFEICESLAELGFPVTENWQETARSLDTRLEVVRDFYDQTILRAKDMATGLLSTMKQSRVTRGVLCCDGYMREILERWFKGHEISYSFVIPKFRVPRL